MEGHICFIMEDEVTNIIIPPSVEGTSSSMVVASPLVQLLIVKWCHKGKKTDDETNVGKRWNGIAFVNILDLYEKKWKHFDKSCLLFKHWTHIRTKNHDQLSNECHRKEEQINKKIEKMKGEH